MSPPQEREQKQNKGDYIKLKDFYRDKKTGEQGHLLNRRYFINDKGS